MSETMIDLFEQLTEDVQNLVNDYSKPTWSVSFATTVHADNEDEAIRLAKIDFAYENCVINARHDSKKERGK